MVLDGSTRLIPSGTNYFELNPESDEIVIIGTNGSGKSTIINYWTPLPPASMKKEFIKGGKKITEWEHRGSYYKIISENTTGAGSHTFIKDSETLLEEGTASVLTQLIKDHFNIDKDIHELMIGKQRFTSMNITERREWIMRISGGDFTFVMDLFMKASVKMRDSLGALRHTKQRLIELEKDRVSESEVIELKQGLDEINKVIANVINIKQTIKPSRHIPGDPMKYLESCLTELELNASKHLKLVEDNFKNLHSFNADLNSVTDKSDVLISELNLRNEQLNNLLSDLKGLNEKEKIIEESKSLGKLESELKAVNDNLILIQNQYIDNTTFNEISDPDNSLSTFHAIGTNLNSILSAWNYELASRDIEKEYADLKQKKLDLEIFISKAERYISELQHKLIHIRNTDDVECPKCNHKWKLGIPQGEEDTIIELMEKSNLNLKKATDRLTNCNDQLVIVEAFLTIKREYVSLMRSTPSLKSLWVSLQDSSALTQPDVSVKQIVDTWLKTVRDRSSFLNYSKDKQRLEEKISFIKSIDIDTNNFSAFKSQVEDKIQKQYEIIDGVKSALLSNNATIKSANSIKTSLNEIQQLITRTSSVVNDVVSSIGMNIFEKVNDDLNKDSYSLNSMLIRSQNSYAVLNELETALENLKQTHEAYTVLVSELSPKEGFVAELLTSFIRQMLKDMNDVISSLWTYDLEIQMCKKAETELDFKFPLSVKNNEHGAEDVADGSSAQVDVVDFAFKYIVVQYLGMTDFPFLLDELAPTFDELHRRNIMHFIRQLIDTNVCTQLVMISHYAETHSAFVKSEYVVTDSFNITVPSIYNKNAVFR